MFNRENTRKIRVGTLEFGGSNRVIIQSMTNTKTSNIEATVNQILELESVGCELVRVAVLNMDDALSISKIKSQIHIPISCDIHFDYRLALECIKQGCDKIRLNPGNLQNEEYVKLVVNACKEKHIPIRIGVNTGSLPKGMEHTAKNLVDAALMHINILEKEDFYDIIVSLKASNTLLAIEAYELASKTFNYPLHLGITEAGTKFSGSIKSAIGIGVLLKEGIGSTIRVSLTDSPIEEIKVCKEILKTFGLIDNIPNLISCPTCGRLQYNMIPIANAVEKHLEKVNKKITIAIMGCAVNGPGEAKSADIGIAGGVNEALLFKKGEIVKKVKQEDILTVLLKEIDDF